MTTRTTRLSLLVLLAGVLALGFACKKKGADEKKGDGAKKDMEAVMAAKRPEPMGPAMAPPARPMTPAPMVAKPTLPDPMTATPTTPVPVAVAKGAGPVYFGTKDSGLVALHQGKFTHVFTQKKWIKAVARASDGTLYIAAIGGVFRVKNGVATKIGGYRNVGSPDAITTDSKGGLWTVSYKGVGYYDGTRWTVEKKDKLGKVSLLKSVAVDAQGRVLVASSNALHLRENNTWKTLDLSKVTTGRVYFKHVALSPTGAFFAGCSKALLKVEKGQVSSVPIVSRYVRDMTMGNDGRIYLKDMYNLYVLDPAGKQLKFFSLKTLGVKATRIDKMAGDAAGRLWLTTDHGVVIVDRGKALQWEPGVFREISGQLSLVYPVAGGPATLPAVGKKITGNVRGTIVRDGAVVPKAVVEICASPSSYFRGTPCARAAWKQVTESDNKGVFLFKDVPVGTYGFAIQGGKKWAVVSRYSSKCCTKIQAGQTHDVGKLKLKKLKGPKGPKDPAAPADPKAGEEPKK